MSEDLAARPPSKRRRFSLGRLIDDFVVLATGQFFAKVFGFFAFAWLARVLPVAEYGAVETAVGMTAIGIVAIELGTGAVGVRRVARGAPAAETIGAVVGARLAIAILVAPALAIAYAGLTKLEAPDALFWLFALSLFAVPFNANWFFQSQERMAVAGFGQTLKMGVFLLAILLLDPGRRGATNVAYAEILAGATMALWYSALVLRATGREKFRFKAADSAVLVRESAALGLSAFVNSLAQYLPILIVATVAGGVETAQFGAAQRLTISLITFSFVYYFNLYPLIARRLVDDPGALKNIIDASVRVTAWAGATAGAALWAIAPLIMRVIFGNDFETAGAEFGLLAWSIPLVLASGNARWLLVGGGRQASLLAAQLAAAAVSVLLCFAAAPSLGGVGAALAFIGGAIAVWIVAHRQTRGLPVRPSLRANLPAAATAGAVVAALTALEPGRWTGFAVAAAIFAVGMALDRRLPSALMELARAKSGAGQGPVAASS